MIKKETGRVNKFLIQWSDELIDDVAEQKNMDEYLEKESLKFKKNTFGKEQKTMEDNNQKSTVALFFEFIYFKFWNAHKLIEWLVFCCLLFQ